MDAAGQGSLYDQRMDKPRLNPKFPACAYVARRLLAEVYGCKPGDQIPGEEELVTRAREVGESDYGKAGYVLQMVEEIGGIFEADPG